MCENEIAPATSATPGHCETGQHPGRLVRAAPGRAVRASPDGHRAPPDGVPAPYAGLGRSSGSSMTSVAGVRE
jgi:hypothetical protein